MIIYISGVMIKLRPSLGTKLRLRLRYAFTSCTSSSRERVESNFAFRQLNKGNYHWSSSAMTHKSLLVEFFSKTGLL